MSELVNMGGGWYTTPKKGGDKYISVQVDKGKEFADLLQEWAKNPTGYRIQVWSNNKLDKEGNFNDKRPDVRLTISKIEPRSPSPENDNSGVFF